MTASERIRAALGKREKPEVRDVALLLDEYTQALRQLAWYKRNWERLIAEKKERKKLEATNVE